MCALVSVPLAIGEDYSAACFFVGMGYFNVILSIRRQL